MAPLEREVRKDPETWLEKRTVRLWARRGDPWVKAVRKACGIREDGVLRFYRDEVPTFYRPQPQAPGGLTCGSFFPLSISWICFSCFHFGGWERCIENSGVDFLNVLWPNNRPFSRERICSTEDTPQGASARIPIVRTSLCRFTSEDKVHSRGERGGKGCEALLCPCLRGGKAEELVPGGKGPSGIE